MAVIPRGAEEMKCYVCGEEKAREYSHFNINQDWARKNIDSSQIQEDTCWLCKGCKEDEWRYDSNC